MPIHPTMRSALDETVVHVVANPASASDELDWRRRLPLQSTDTEDGFVRRDGARMHDFQWTRAEPLVPGEYWWRAGEGEPAFRVRIQDEATLPRLRGVGEWWRPHASFSLVPHPWPSAKTQPASAQATPA